MRYTLNYNKVSSSLNSLDIEDISNFNLECTNNLGYFYFLIVKTILGESHIFTFGPLVPDFEILLSGVNYSYNKIEYKEKKITFLIQKFVNDFRKNITDVRLISLDEILDVYADMGQYVKKLMYNDLEEPEEIIAKEK